MFCFSQTCRICKRSTKSFTLTCNGQKEVNNLFFSMFPVLMNSKLNHLLKNLCEYCVKQLQLFENFKNQCIESDKCYMRYLNQLGDHGDMHAELVCKLGIKQEQCQSDDSKIPPTFEIHGTQESSSYYNLERLSSSTAEAIQFESLYIKPEIIMPEIKQENEDDAIDEAISVLGCEEFGKEEIIGKSMRTNQELFATDYQRSIDKENPETVELSNNSRIKDFNLTIIDSSVNTSGSIKQEYCQGKENLSNITEDIEIVKHEVDIANTDGSCNSFDLSLNNNGSQEIEGKKNPLNHHKMKHTGIVQHKRTHTFEKHYQCDICKKSFSQKSHFTDHIRIHTGEKPFQCNLCKKSYSKSTNLIRHKRTHIAEKHYECDTCKISFSDKRTFVDHNRTHTGEKPPQCDLCNKSFLDQRTMIIHKRTHTGEKPYQCDFCYNSFADKRRLIIHKRTHTGEKPYECEICKKRFARKSDMIRHKRTHTGERPYECDICKKSFSRKFVLIQHKRIHTGEKPFECEICKKRFSQKKIVLKHKRTHTREAGFSAQSTVSGNIAVTM